MSPPDLNSQHFSAAWEKLLNNKVFQDDRVGKMIIARII